MIYKNNTKVNRRTCKPPWMSDWFMILDWLPAGIRPWGFIITESIDGTGGSFASFAKVSHVAETVTLAKRSLTWRSPFISDWWLWVSEMVCCFPYRKRSYALKWVGRIFKTGSEVIQSHIAKYPCWISVFPIQPCPNHNFIFYERHKTEIRLLFLRIHMSIK